MLVGAGLSLFGLLDSDSSSLLSSVKNSVCPHRLENLLLSLFSRYPVSFPATSPYFHIYKCMLYAYNLLHIYISLHVQICYIGGCMLYMLFCSELH